MLDIEKMADAKYLESGWTRAPLKDRNGIRYYDGKGNTFQLNNGYPCGKDMHGGPYIKTTQGNQTVRTSNGVRSQLRLEFHGARCTTSFPGAMGRKTFIWTMTIAQPTWLS